MTISDSSAGPLPGLPYRLRLPGPTAVPDRILRAAAKPIVAHRGRQFLKVFGDIVDRLQPIFGREPNSIPAFVYASTGIGGMESAVVNVVAPGERFLVCTNGQWGPVFRRLIETFGGEVDEVVGPFGGAIDLEAVEKHLKRRKVVLSKFHAPTFIGREQDIVCGFKNGLVPKPNNPCI